jgi:transposase
MARKPRTVAAMVTAAEQVVRTTSDARELRRAQALLLPSVHGMTIADTARVIGRTKASVSRLRAEFCRQAEQPERPRPQWGGRRRQHMTVAEETAFLEPFLAQAGQGGILVVAPLKTAYEKAIGRAVPDSTVYRLLARHGWRKIAPRPHHPKGNPELREGWKKNSRKR